VTQVLQVNAENFFNRIEESCSAMFATMSRFASPRDLGSVYRKTGVEIDVHGASPHRLVAMLFDGLMEALAQAQGAIANRNIEAKVNAIGRAVRILDEGLKSALDLKEGGRLAADLNDLYAYVSLRLTQANLRNDLQALDECKQLIQPLRQAWTDIAPHAEQGAR
jgi:flagellar secretion chaperone FliS